MSAEHAIPGLSASIEKMSREELVAEITRLRAAVVEMTRLADAVPHIVWTTDKDGAATYFNAKWREYTGLDLAETLRAGAGTLVHPDDLPRFVTAMANAKANGAPFEITYRLRHRATSVHRWHIARVVPLLTQGGQVEKWIATATEVDEQRAREEEQRYLVETSEVLGRSLELRQTLNVVATLLVPHMADWCAIDLLTDAGTLDRQAVAHVDPSKVVLAWDLWKRMPPRPDDPHGAYAVVRTGSPDVVREVTDEHLQAWILDPEVLEIVRSLGLRSLMTVPLAVRERVIGVLTLVTSESGKSYGDRDLTFATELARRIAVAVDNARLYGAAEQAKTAAEAIAADVVEQSRAVAQELVSMRGERDAALKRADAVTSAKAPERT